MGGRGGDPVLFCQLLYSSSFSSLSSCCSSSLGYAVILLRRKGSIAPFARWIEEFTGTHVLDLHFLSHMRVQKDSNGKEHLLLGENEQHVENMIKAVSSYQKVVRSGPFLLESPDLFFLCNPISFFIRL